MPPRKNNCLGELMDRVNNHVVDDIGPRDHDAMAKLRVGKEDDEEIYRCPVKDCFTEYRTAVFSGRLLVMSSEYSLGDLPCPDPDP